MLLMINYAKKLTLCLNQHQEILLDIQILLEVILFLIFVIKNNIERIKIDIKGDQVWIKLFLNIFVNL